jgi:hypothetical protein
MINKFKEELNKLKEITSKQLTELRECKQTAKWRKTAKAMKDEFNKDTEILKKYQTKSWKWKAQYPK